MNLTGKYLVLCDDSVNPVKVIYRTTSLEAALDFIDGGCKEVEYIIAKVAQHGRLVKTRRLEPLPF